jgi:hypothetical protein
MIRKFIFENYYSYLDKTEVSFLVNPSEVRDNKCAKTPLGHTYTKLLCVMGPNASGKSHLLEALEFIANFSTNSFKKDPNSKINVSSHYASKNKESSFVCEFELDKKIYKYELSLSSERVIHERLLYKNGNVWRKNYSRKWSKKDKKYDYDLPDFLLDEKQIKTVRKNSSVLSTARQYNVELAESISEFMNSIIGNDNIIGGHLHFPQSAKYFYNNKSLRKQSEQILKKFDPSLTGIEIKKKIHIDEETGEENTSFFPYGIHTFKKNNSTEVHFFNEAGGTRAIYSLLLPILHALENGGVAIIDELEANLHPLMINTLLNLFISPETNKKNAQILFSCHAPHVLNFLDKQQILITEKYNTHYSEAWRLDEIKGVNRRENFYANYMAGKFGGVPD